MLEKYMRMLEFTKNDGFDEEAVAEVQAKIDKLQKEMTKEPPPGHVLESTIQFLERAKKRQCKAHEALEKAQEEVIRCMEAVQQYEDEVKEAEIRLEQVKSELAGNG
jgi:phage shock protein A